MWFLVIVPSAVVGVAAAAASLLGATKAAGVGLAVLEIQRRQGFKPGEGLLTPRADGWEGTDVSTESESALGRTLAGMCLMLPEALPNMVGKNLLLTQSEGEQLRSMVAAVQKTYSNMADTGLFQALREEPDNEELRAIAAQSMETLTMLAEPVAIFLNQFPRARVRDIKK